MSFFDVWVNSYAQIDDFTIRLPQGLLLKENDAYNTAEYCDKYFKYKKREKNKALKSATLFRISAV